MTMPSWPQGDGTDPYAVPSADGPVPPAAPAPAPVPPPYGAPAPSGYEATLPYPSSGGYGTPPAPPAYGTPTYGTPTYGTPGYGTPGYGTPGYGTPTYGAPGYGTPGYGYGAPPVWQQAAPPNDGLAIGAFITSLSALVVGVTAPVGAILGIVALNRVKRTGAGGKGFAIAAIAVGSAITLIGALYIAFLVSVFASLGAAGATAQDDGWSGSDTSDGGPTWDDGPDGEVVDPADAYVSGDCLAFPVYGWLEDGEPADCAQPHGAEVVGEVVYDPIGEPYDYEALDDALWRHCQELVHTLATPEYDAGLVWTDYVVPSEELWSTGHASGTCLVSADEPVLTGSAYAGTLVVAGHDV